MSPRPPILILHATGTNRDREAAWACELAGGAAEIVHINRLTAGEVRLSDYRMLVLPGGFSYGDDLGAGKLWAVALRYRLAEPLAAFIAAGRPVLGICNGFQALVKAGLLPGGGNGAPAAARQTVTLTRNDSARFECRWVYLQPQATSPCVFTCGLEEPIHCPVAHGEGKFVPADATTLAELEAGGLVALRYARPDGQRQPDQPAGYPWNPNGSAGDIAGICNAAGTVLGLMPHPENHIIEEQGPRFRRGERDQLGLALFRNGIRYAAAL
jgi:phosphoribosylformylglycinamidine synthase